MATAAEEVDVAEAAVVDAVVAVVEGAVAVTTGESTSKETEAAAEAAADAVAEAVTITEAVATATATATDKTATTAATASLLRVALRESLRVGALNQLLERVDGKSYNFYKDIRGIFTVRIPTASQSISSPGGVVFVRADHIQGDAYAPPSKFGVIIAPELAKVPPHLYNNRVRRVAAGDFFARSFFR